MGRRARRSVTRARSGGDSLGAWTQAEGPMHATICGGRACRPGEGNLKGYQHWMQPYEQLPLDRSLAQTAPHGWGRGSPFPASHYAELVAGARRAAASAGYVALAAADFDYRELAHNWHRAAVLAGMDNALVYALDAEACEYLRARGVPFANGTANLEAWRATRLTRHLQRALAERHMAAAAIAHGGVDVLLTDATHVFVRSPHATFRGAPPAADVLSARAGCDAARLPHAGCAATWNFMYLRGAGSDERRARVVSFVQAAVDLGMVDFYLRWWSGHHCIYGGYDKLYRSSNPRLEGDMSAAANAARPNVTSLVSLALPRGGPRLSIAQLPSALFPPAGEYAAHAASALVGRSARPHRSHRLRLDRYDDEDFDGLRKAMKDDGLWRLGPADTLDAPTATPAGRRAEEAPRPVDECWYMGCHEYCDERYARGSFCVNNACGDDACCRTADESPGATADSPCLGGDAGTGAGGVDLLYVGVGVGAGVSLCLGVGLLVWWRKRSPEYRRECLAMVGF